MCIAPPFLPGMLRSTSPLVWRCDEYATQVDHYWEVPCVDHHQLRPSSVDRLSRRLKDEAVLTQFIRALGRVPTTTVLDSICGSGLYQEIIVECYSGNLYQYMYRHGLKVDDAAIAAMVMACVHGSHNAKGVSVSAVLRYLQRHAIMPSCAANDIIRFVRGHRQLAVTRDHMVQYVPQHEVRDVVGLIADTFGLGADRPGASVHMWAVLALCRHYPHLFGVTPPLTMSDVLQSLLADGRLTALHGLCSLTK